MADSDAFRPVALVPTYNNPKTVRAVVEGVRAHLPDVIVVDDGSGAEGRAACEALAADGLATVVHLPENGGKGAAVKAGFAEALRLGHSHAFQIDADGQHSLAEMPEFLAAARAHPEALVLSVPQFGDDVPEGRIAARKITQFWVDLETGGKVIGDPMCGYRVYPLAACDGLAVTSDRMAFDPEVAVRLVWGGTPVINLPVPVFYPEDRVSHFRVVRDNVGLSWLHARLCTEKVFGWLVLGRRYHRRVLELGSGS